jgi:hypothetical protein
MTEPPNELLAVTLARIETKLDNAIHLGADHEGRLRRVESRHDDADHDNHERRITSLEGRQWPLPSAAMVLSVAAAIMPFIVR